MGKVPPCSQCWRDQAEVENWLDKLERMLRQGMFYEVDLLLKRFDTDATGSASLIAVATMTFHAKAHLHVEGRDAFIERVELTLTDRLGAERAKKLLENRR